VKRYDTREQWLNTAVTHLRQDFRDIGVGLPNNIRVSCAWSKNAKKNGVAWCWKSESSGDGATEIQISPEVADPAKVLGNLVHELIHAADNCASKHSGFFRETAKRIGLTGKMTATVPGDSLTNRLNVLAIDMGDYPHAALDPNAASDDKPKQTTRMLKATCPQEGYTVRLTQKWVDVGLPYCPCGMEMTLEIKDDNGE
jgi:hypothetical protein